jgi:hypothetical protein
MYRRTNVFLVGVDGQYVLVDQNQGVMHVVNAAGARAWAQLGTTPVDTEFGARLQELGLTSEQDEAAPVELAVPEAIGRPELLTSNLILQVAASGYIE